jgi:hypothetical protein
VAIETKIVKTVPVIARIVRGDDLARWNVEA